MKRLLLTAIAAILAIGSGQGVLERLEGDFKILARATNGVGTIFVEIDAAPANLIEALRDGLLEEPSDAFVLVTPASVGYAIEVQGHVYVESMPWTPFVAANEPVFTTDTLEIDGDGGRLLNFESIREVGALGPPSNAVIRQPPRNGCVSTSTSAGSSMTCYSDGRVTYRSTCTIEPTTYAVNCRSDYY